MVEDLTKISFGGELFSKIDVVIENTEIVNKTLEFSFMCFTVPFGLITLLLNVSVLMKLWKKEKTIVNQLMMMDCIMNIMFSHLATFQQSPYFRGLEIEVYCNFHLALAYAFNLFNRLCPLAIVGYR